MLVLQLKEENKENINLVQKLIFPVMQNIPSTYDLIFIFCFVFKF